MLTKILAGVASAIALVAIVAGYTQRSALTLREEKQPHYWPRYSTDLSGTYRGGNWQALPNRSSYSEFRGGGPSTGK